MLILHGHPFSSYTWKALIPLYANGTAFEFRTMGNGSRDDDDFVSRASPLGQFPVLRDGDRSVFEATSIVEYLHLHYPGEAPLLPADPDAAIEVRTMDRVFDIAVMNRAQETVAAYLRDPDAVDRALVERVRQSLDRVYRWLDDWLVRCPRSGDAITLVECAAAPALFYAD